MLPMSAGQFRSFAHQRDEAGAATRRTEQIRLTKLRMLMPSRNESGQHRVKVRQHGPAVLRYRSVLPNRSRGFTTGGVHQGNQHHQRGHFHCGQQQAFQIQLLSTSPLYFQEVTVVGGTYTGLANQHHPRAQRVRQAKAVKADTIGAAQPPRMVEALIANGAPDAAI